MNQKKSVRVVESFDKLFSKNVAENLNAPKVNTAQGLCEGYQENQCHCFEGIPYAKAPVGERRFKAPERMDAWEGILLCKRLGPEPIQNIGSSTSYENQCFKKSEERIMSEDCLYLNVYSKNNNVKKKAVMVWIYGGSFTEGSANPYKSLSLVNHTDVVLVTFNYRSGIFGFLYHSDTNTEHNNCALLDQIAALKWVKENIENFGGDPDNITVFGESSGAMCISCLLVNENANKLFQKAILQSGTCSMTQTSKQALSVQKTFLKSLSLKRFDIKKLQELSTDCLLNAQNEMELVKSSAFKLGFNFAPVIDQNLLKDRPACMLQRGVAKNIPIMIGFNENEWLAFNEMSISFEKDTSLIHCFTYTKNICGFSWTNTLLSILKFKRWLFLEDKPDSFKDAACELINTVLFEKPAIKLAIEQCRFADTYLFEFSHKAEDEQHQGACHGLDLYYLFDWLGEDQSEKQVSITQKLQSIWASFAQTGKPPQLKCLQEWPDLAQNTHQLMQLDTINKLIPIPHEHLNESLY